MAISLDESRLSATPWFEYSLNYCSERFARELLQDAISLIQSHGEQAMRASAFMEEQLQALGYQPDDAFGSYRVIKFYLVHILNTAQDGQLKTRLRLEPSPC